MFSMLAFAFPLLNSLVTKAMLLLLLLFSFLFAGGNSDTATLKFNLKTNPGRNCVVGDPVATLWVETLGGDFKYLMTYNVSEPGIDTQYSISVDYSRPTNLYFHWIDCNEISIDYCFPVISSVTIENGVTGPQTVSTCTKILRRLSSTRIRFNNENGIIILAGSGSCNSTGPYCSNSSECCLPSPAVSSSSTLFSSLTLPTSLALHTTTSSLMIPSMTTPSPTSSTVPSPTPSESFSDFSEISQPPSIQPSLSLFSSSSSDVMLTSSLMVSPTPSPSSHCPEEDQWPKTRAGEIANDTCYQGIFNASRYCRSDGKWNETRCYTTKSFNAILLRINISPLYALQGLLELIQNNIPSNQAVILLNLIISEVSYNATSPSEQFIKIVLEIAGAILNNTEGNSPSVTTQLLLTLDTFALNLRKDTSQSFGDIFLNVKQIQSFANNTLRAIEQNQNTLSLPNEAFTNSLPATVASFVYSNLSSILSPTDGRELISPVISAVIDCNGTCITNELTEPVNISFNVSGHTQQTLTDDSIISCVFWNITVEEYSLPSGFWDNKGCNVTVVDGQSVTCQCNHLTHFAILLSPGESPPADSVHYKILTIAGQILVPISLVCLLMVILTYSCLRSLWSMRNYIHIMLCSNLFISQLIFLIGIEQTANPSLCSAIAVLLQYMFLVTFMWMLMEGVVLYVSLVKVFVKHPKHYVIGFTVLSYGVPALYMLIIVPIGFLVNTTDHSHYLYYADDNLVACWLSYESGFIWSFIGPVLLIIMANVGFFVMAIVIMKRHQKKQIHKKQSCQTKYWIKASLSLTIVMGIGYIVNILFFTKQLIFIAYISTVFIAGQGIIIFILYVPLSSNVREAYGRWWKKKQANSDILSKMGFHSSNDTMNGIKKKKSVVENTYGHYTLGTNGGDDLDVKSESKDRSPSPASTLSKV